MIESSSQQKTGLTNSKTDCLHRDIVVVLSSYDMNGTRYRCRDCGALLSRYVVDDEREFRAESRLFKTLNDESMK